MNQTSAVHSRNKWMLFLSWALLAAGLAFDLANGSSMQATLLFFAVGAFGNLLLTGLISQRWIIRATPYLMIVNFALQSSLLIHSHPALTTYSLVYCTLALIALYQNWRPIAVAGAVEALLSIAYFYGYGDAMFPSTHISLLLTLELFVGIMTALLACQSYMAALKLHEVMQAKTHSDHLVQRLLDSSQHLRTFNTQLVDNVTATSRISREVTVGFGEVAKGIEHQAISVHEILTSLQTVNDGVIAVHNAAHTMHNVSTDTAQMTDRGHQQVKHLIKEMEHLAETKAITVQMMKELQQNTRRIGHIVQKVHELSEQSNLLALNATIEAARAGEAGRSFAVVANEVRKLAANSQRSTEEIGEILERIRNQTEQISERVYEGQRIIFANRQATDSVDHAFRQITQNTKSVLDQARDVSDRILHLQTSSQEVVSEVTAIAGITEQSSAAVEQILASIEVQDARIAEIVKSFDVLESLIKEFH